ncbi:MAG: hypothetical protein GX053_05725 [Tissierella sp.]|nr:hypothetical protein [Tissierella sp.]
MGTENMVLNQLLDVANSENKVKAVMLDGPIRLYEKVGFTKVKRQNEQMIMRKIL